MGLYYGCLVMCLYCERSKGGRGFFSIYASYESNYPRFLRASNYFKATKMALLSFLFSNSLWICLALS